MSSKARSSAIAIRASGLSKVYTLGRRQEHYRTFRDAIMRTLKAPLRRRKGAAGETRLWALKDVSLEVREGEVLGLIGRNGAGKTTLLKVLSRITPPTHGRAEIHGRVGSLLEVGTGFHQELTGRENVYLNGAILGMRKAEIDRRFDEMIAFAELADFVDTPVKNYSSGMYMRLAFAVAAHMDTEILLVDEVLAVGDAAFQQKCLGKMGDVAAAGRTVLFVSHNMAAVAGLCSRAVWIDHGSVQADGRVETVTQAYLDALSHGSFNCVSRDKALTVHGIALRNREGRATNQFSPGDDLAVEIQFEAARRIEAPAFEVIVQSLHGPAFAANMALDGNSPDVLSGPGRIECRFRGLPLLPQSYTVRIGVRAANRDRIIDLQDVGAFTVAGDLRAFGFRGAHEEQASKWVPIVVPYDWTLPDGSLREVGLGRERVADARPAKVPVAG